MIKTYKGLRMVQSPSLAGKVALVHGFLTRRPGDMDRPAKNRAWPDGMELTTGKDGAISDLAAVFNVQRKFVIRLEQVHSTNVLIVDKDLPFRNNGTIKSFDAAVTDVKGVLLTVRTADCAPILLFDGVKGLAAAIHAGWRGAAGGITSRTVEVMVERFGSHPANIHAAIGPSIGKCCYEVGIEVAQTLAGSGAPADGMLMPSAEDRWLFDLKRLNFVHLLEKGLSPGNIHISHHCTKCEPDHFHSYRREGAGCSSQISFIGMI